MRKVLSLASLAFLFTISTSDVARADNFNGKRWKLMGDPKYSLLMGYTCPSGQTVGYTYRTWRVGAVVSGAWIHPSKGLFVYCFQEQ